MFNNTVTSAAGYDNTLVAQGDPYLSSVVLLIPGSGAPTGSTLVQEQMGLVGALTNTNVVYSLAASKFGSSSLYFNGAAQLSYAATSVYSFGTSDFTVECWWKSNGTQTQYAPIFSQSFFTGTPAAGTWGLKVVGNSTGPQLTWNVSGTLTNLDVTTVSVDDGNWHHIAAVRSGTNVYIFVDGVQQATTTISSGQVFGNTGNPLVVGYESRDNAYINGYVQDLRITVGIARYTAQFVPPGFSQNTESNFIDVTEDKTVLELNFEGTGTMSSTNLPADSSRYGRLATLTGSPTYNTTSARFGSSCGSFTNGNWFSFAHTSEFNMGSNNFTIECWVYIPAVSSIIQGSALIGDLISSSTTSYIFGYFATAGSSALTYYLSSNGSTFDIASAVSMGTVPQAQWTHVALVRNGNVFTPYINGIAGTQTTSSLALYPAAVPLCIGSYTGTGVSYVGYMDGLRITNGLARYTTNFVPPTTALTTTIQPKSPTVLLLDFEGQPGTNVFVDRSPYNHGTANIFNGSPTLSTAQAKFGNTSGSFSTSNWIEYPDALEFNFKTNNFTIECWIYLTSTPSASGNSCIASKGWGVMGNSPWLFGYFPTAGSTGVSFYSSSSGSSWDLVSGLAMGVIPLNSWTHLAVVRNGAIITTYLNGVQQGQTTSTLSVYSGPTSTNISIGGSTLTGSNGITAGYIDDFCITNGVAKYGQTFTPPAAPLTVITNETLFLDGSSVTTDQSTTPVALTSLTVFTGTAATSVTQPNNLFGSSSPSALKFTGTGALNTAAGYLQFTNATTAMDFGVGDLTVELWLYLTNTPTTYTQILNPTTSTTNYGGLRLGLSSSGAPQLDCCSNGGTTPDLVNAGLGAPIPLNTWQHIAVVRSGGYINIFQNGKCTFAQALTGTMYASGANGGKVVIGGRSDGYGLGGYIYDLRVLKGTAMYPTQGSTTSAFIVPQSALTTYGTNNNSLTTLLLNFEGQANGSTIFTDSSAYNHYVTPVGTAAISTAQFKYGSASGLFNSTSYLTVPYAPEFNFGTNNFTVEAWIYIPALSSIAANTYLLAKNQSWALSFPTASSGVLNYYLSSNGSTWDIQSGASLGTLTAGTWNHVALVRNGTTFTPYLNGVAGTTTTSSLTLNANLNNVLIGGAGSGLGFPGYIDDVRITNSAVYTAAFNVPNHQLANFNNTTTTLLLNFDGTNGSTTFVDSSSYGETPTVVGSGAALSTAQFKYGTASLVATATSWISIPSATSLILGANNFTIECWYYPTGSTTGSAIASKGWNGGVGSGWIFGYNGGSNSLNWYHSTANGAWSFGPLSMGTPTSNTWSHLAVVRNGNVYTTYLNGVQQATGTSAGTIYDSGAALTIGGPLSGSGITGYLDDFRIVNGAVVYTSNFLTLPTQPQQVLAALPTQSQTALLLHFDNNLTDSSVYNATLTNGGGVTFSNSVYKFGGYSASFPATATGYLSAPNIPAYSLGTNDFTIETWLYVNSFTSPWSVIVCSWVSGAYSWIFEYSTTQIQFVVNTSVTATFTYSLPTSTWTHVALVRRGGLLTLFVNGVNVGTQTYTTTIQAATTALWIGANQDTNVWHINGYLDDLRIVNGTALYSNNFTPTSNSYSLQPLFPVAQQDPYANNVILLVNGNGANSGTTFTDAAQNFPITATGSVTSTGQSKWNGSSMFFNGSSNYLSIPNSYVGQAFGIGSNNFTLECWVYLNSASAASCIISQDNGGGSTPKWAFGFNVLTANNFSLHRNQTSGTQANINWSYTPTASVWTHIAVVRNGNNWTFYSNGVSQGTFVDSNSLSLAGGLTSAATIGELSEGAWYFNGYMQDLRITLNVARYTQNFVPPTAMLTLPQYVQQQTDPYARYVTALIPGGGATSSTTATDIISNTSLVFGTGVTVSNVQNRGIANSIKFPNTSGIGATLSSSPRNALGTSNFTMECWFYYASSPAGILSNSSATYAANMWLIRVSAANVKFAAYNNNSLIGTDIANNPATLVTNTWNHIAVTRNGNSFTVYVNGVPGTAGTFAGSLDGGGTQPLLLGLIPNGTSTSGYIQDVRVTIGAVRYTGTFTPPQRLQYRADQDLYGNSTTLLISGNGTSGATTINETSGQSVGFINISGSNPSITSANPLFNQNVINLTGTSAFYVNGFNYADWNDNFTCEGWFYITAKGSGGTGDIMVASSSTSSATSTDWATFLSPFRLTTSGTTNLTLFVGSGSGWNNSNAGYSMTVPAMFNSWTHIACTRQISGTNSIFTIYVNGAMVGSTTIANSSVYTVTATKGLVIGGQTYSAANYTIFGQCANIRLSTGVLRYTSSFIPQQAPFATLAPASLGYFGSTTYAASYAVIGGGGGGGNNWGGGGGAGGVATGTVNLSTGRTYNITIGSGGAGAASNTVIGSSGGNSSITGIAVAYGGGGGGDAGVASVGFGGAGGSGGGSTATTTGVTVVGGLGVPGQGYNGGTGTGSTTGINAPAAGGGGAGGVGANSISTQSGAGGSSITLSAILGGGTYAGGGGGGGASGSVNPGAGGGGGAGAGSGTAGGTGGTATANTGSGGGGGGTNSGVGGAGGSGIVILSVPTANYATAVATGTFTTGTSGSNTWIKWTTNGTYTA